MRFTSRLPAIARATPSAAALLLAALAAACSGGGGGSPAPQPLKVTGSVSGSAAAGVTVTLTGARSATTTTDAWGRYAFTDLVPGTYAVTPAMAGHVFSPVSRAATLTVAGIAGQGFTATAVAGPTRTISGTVSGASSAGVTVTLGGQGSGATITAADGSYAFAGVADGSYTVRPSRSGSAFAPPALSATVIGADLAGQDFAQGAAHAISGTIAGPSPSGVALTLGGAGTGSTFSDASGRYAFANLPDGTYTVAPSRTGFAFGPPAVTVTLAGADASGLDFAEVGAYGISGTVAGAGTRSVTMKLSGDAAATVGTDASGAFAFTGVPPGRYTVTPSLPGWAFSPASLAVPVGLSPVTGQGFAGMAVPVALHGISGTVSGVAKGGVLISLSGTASGYAVTASAYTDRTGGFAFPGLADGSYTLTPSGSGYAYTPASLPVVLSGADAGGRSFTSAITPTTLSGTVTYAGTRIGPVFVTVLQNSVPGTGYTAGTRLTGPGSFAIRGLQYPGRVTVMAWMDTLGIGRFNAAADPYAWANVSLTPPSTSGFTIALADPAPLAPAPPASVRAFSATGATAVTFQPPVTAEGFEAAERYTLYWSDDPSTPVGPGNARGSFTVPAGSGRARIAAVTPATFPGSPPLWFAATATAQGAESAPTAASPSPLPISPPGGDRRISGRVTFPPSATARLVVTAIDPFEPAVVYSAEVADATASPRSYAIAVPSGRYVLRAYLDEGDDGLLGPNDPSLADAPQTSMIVDVGGADATGRDLALPTARAVAKVTSYQRVGLAPQLRFDVSSNLGTPVTATVTSGPNVRVPYDLGVSNALASQLTHFSQYYQLNAQRPSAGDAYEIVVAYADGSAETLTASLRQVLAAAPTPVAPAGAAPSLTPTFAWTPPSPAPSGPYAYVVFVQSAAGVYVTPWLPSSQTSWTYGGPPLAPATTYSWYVEAVDADGDVAVSAYPPLRFTTP